MYYSERKNCTKTTWSKIIPEIEYLFYTESVCIFRWGDFWLTSSKKVDPISKSFAVTSHKAKWSAISYPKGNLKNIRNR
jgi:hypothetical protein